MNALLLAAIRARHARGGWAAPPAAPPASPGASLLGVGSASTSLTAYPKTGSVTTGSWHVDPAAVTNGNGSSGSPFDNLGSALAAVSDGQRILVHAGTLTLTGNIYRNTAWSTGIEIFNYGDDRPIIDAAALSDGNAGIAIMLDGSSAREHWKGFEVINAPNVGIDVKGVNHTIEDVWVNHCLTSAEASGAGRSALRSIGTGARNNLIQDCAVWRCGDGVNVTYNAPDCYQIAASTGVQTGSKWVRCFGAHGQDDIFDMWAGSGAEAIDCVAFRGGYYWSGVSGSSGGSGFKAGGSRTGVGNNTIKGCIAIQCKSEAIKTNSSPEPCTFLNNTVVGSAGADMTLDTASSGKHTVTNNIALGTVYKGDPTYSTERYNTWNDPADAGSNADFPITNAQFAAAADYDWSLAVGSPCIGASDAAGNLGASDVALEIALEWLAKDLT